MLLSRSAVVAHYVLFCAIRVDFVYRSPYVSLKFLCCRTNSDSALHQSTLIPAQQASFTGGSQELQPKRGTRDFEDVLVM